jgi:hypothetical protein
VLGDETCLCNDGVSAIILDKVVYGALWGFVERVTTCKLGHTKLLSVVGKSGLADKVGDSLVFWIHERPSRERRGIRGQLGVANLYARARCEQPAPNQFPPSQKVAPKRWRTIGSEFLGLNYSRFDLPSLENRAINTYSNLDNFSCGARYTRYGQTAGLPQSTNIVPLFCPSPTLDEPVISAHP